MVLISHQPTGTMISARILFLVAVLAQYALGADKTYNFREEEPEGAFVGNIARDLNLAALIPANVFTNLKYSIMVWEDGALFRVDKDNSDLFTKANLDREQLCRFENQCLLNLRVAALSETDIRKYSIAVNLLDINDNSPKFNETSYTMKIPESVTAGKKYTIPGAFDDDRGEENSIQTYSIEPPSDIFSIDYFQKLDGTLDVNLVVNGQLDREKKDMYGLVLVARDGGIPQRSASLVISVVVEDDNDNTPRFEQRQYNVQIGENTISGAVIIQLTAVDNDIGANAAIEYRLSFRQDASVAQQFEIDKLTGTLTAKVALASGSYTIFVEAVDGGTPQKVNQTEVFVTVIDTENNPPVIVMDPLNDDSLSARISEAANQDDLVAHVSVYDPDSGKNGAVLCYSQSAFFDLHALEDNDYMVVVARPLDREETAEYRVTLFCEDSGTPRLNATHIFDVVVEDENDNPPVFEKADVKTSIAENNDINDVVMLIPATDRDAGDNSKIYFSLLDDSDGFFRIPVGSNALVCAKTLDRETKDSHVVKILARDGGDPAQSATATVTVSVLDVNDVAPQFFQSNYKFEMSEGLPGGSIVGSVAAFDLDLEEGGEVTFSLPPGSGGRKKFKMLDNGTLMSLTPLDREALGLFKFDIEAKDNGRPSLTSQVEVQVEVTDINDNAPVFLFPSPTNNSVALVLPIDSSNSLLRLQVVDADEGENGNVYFMLQPGNATRLFYVDTVTGELFATKAFDTDDVGVYNLTITATDRGEKPISTTKHLLVQIKTNPETKPVQGADTNAMIAIGLVCGTVVLAAIIVVVVCFVRRRDKGKPLRYLDNKKENSPPRVLDASSLPNQYDSHMKPNNTAFINNNNNNSNNNNNNNISMSSGSEVTASYNKYKNVPKLSVGFPGGFDQYNLQTQPGVRMSMDSMVKGDEVDTSDKELNRVTSLRLQQAFQHISSIKSRLITPSDTSKPYEWREIHIPGHPGDFGSLSSGTNGHVNHNIDSGIGTDDDAVFLRPGSRGVSPSRHKLLHHYHHHHHHYSQNSHSHNHHPRFSSQPPSDLSGDSSQPSCSSLPNLCLRPGSDTFVFRPLSARSSDSYPSETIDDQCTTTSGSYSINMDDHGAPRGSLKVGDLGYIQDVYV